MQRVEIVGIGLSAACLVFLWVYLLSMGSATIAAKESVRILANGQLAAMFLLGVNLVGLVIPLILTAIAYTSSVTGVLVVAGILALVGGYLFRHSMLMAGVYPPIIDL